ncbi:MAG: molecular chaperone DnaJ [Buchnera aphidicola (Tetraneura sorini)]
MTKQDYYYTLGIKKTSSDREIKKAYKRLAIKYHPDRNQGDKNAETKFKEVKEAYEILIDPKKRASYDQYGHNAFQQNSGYNSSGFSSTFETTSDFSDIFGDVFGDIFGNEQQRSSRGSDLRYNMELTLEEAVQGVKKIIRIPILQKCNNCHGSGATPGTRKKNCSSCNGSGKIQMRKGFFTVQQTCTTCQGQKTVIQNPCFSCNGSGRIEKPKSISIKIPAGINTNDQIKLNKEGEAGQNNASSGDLYINITVKKHPIFKRKENDLYCEVPINFCMAALGGNLEVPTLDGKVKFKIPAETQSGKIFRIPKKGVISLRNRKKGDLFCKIFVETPIRLNREQKSLLYKLGESLGGYKGERNNPHSKRFFDGVKRFFDDLTTRNR